MTKKVEFKVFVATSFCFVAIKLHLNTFNKSLFLKQFYSESQKFASIVSSKKSNPIQLEMYVHLEWLIYNKLPA
jgi:hypothetical protein